LTSVKFGKSAFNLRVQIGLTSNQLKGSINSGAGGELIEKFFADNDFALKDKDLFKKLFEVARGNRFTIILE